MTPDDPTVDQVTAADAADPSASAAPADDDEIAGPLAGGDAAKPAEAGEQPADEPSPGDIYQRALDLFFGGHLRDALELVRAQLALKPEEKLAKKLERLQRRAEDRLARGEPPEPEPDPEPEAEAAPPPEESESGELGPIPDAVELDPAPAEAEGSAAEGEPAAEPAEAGAAEPASEDAAAPTAENGESAAAEAGAVAAPEQGGEGAAAPAEEAPEAEAAPPAEGAAPAEARTGRPAPDRTSSGRHQLGALDPPSSPAVRRGPPSSAGGPARRKPAGRPAGGASSAAAAAVARRPGPPTAPSQAPPRRGPGAPPAPAGAGAGAAAIKGELDKLSGAVDTVARAVRGVQDHTLKVAEAYQRLSHSHKRKEQAYDQLYEELRTYKDNFLLQAQKPLFKDVILLFDGISRTLRAFEEREGDTVPREDVLNELRHVRDEVLEVLYRRDIELIEEYPSVLDIEIQKPIRRVETDDPAEDRAVVQVLREGFRMSDVVLRPQEVVVKRCLKERETQ